MRSRGDQCPYLAKDGSAYCRAHEPERRERNRLARIKGKNTAAAKRNALIFDLMETDLGIDRIYYER